MSSCTVSRKSSEDVLRSSSEGGLPEEADLRRCGRGGRPVEVGRSSLGWGRPLTLGPQGRKTNHWANGSAQPTPPRCWSIGRTLRTWEPKLGSSRKPGARAARVTNSSDSVGGQRSGATRGRMEMHWQLLQFKGGTLARLPSLSLVPSGARGWLRGFGRPTEAGPLCWFPFMGYPHPPRLTGSS
jgi:hypothetical protein